MDRWQEKRFNDYLFEVEQCLQHLTVEDRALLVGGLSQELKERLQVCKDQKAFSEALREYGRPYDVACRLTAQKGWPVPKKKGVPFLLKAFLWGVFFAFVFFGFTAYFVYQEMSEVLSMDHGSVNFHVWDGDGQEWRGSEGVEGFQELQVQSSMGKWEVIFSDKKTLAYECRFKGLERPLSGKFIMKDKKEKKLFLSLPQGNFTAECELEVPHQLSLQMNLKAGQIFLQKPNQDVQVNLGYGQLEVFPLEGVFYLPQVEVRKGDVKGLESLLKGEGPQLKLQLEQGQILFHP